MPPLSSQATHWRTSPTPLVLRGGGYRVRLLCRRKGSGSVRGSTSDKGKNATLPLDAVLPPRGVGHSELAEPGLDSAESSWTAASSMA